MMTRTKALLSIRPEITAAKIYDGISSEELFQNKTLRPIIKMQHDLFIAVFRNYIKKRKNVFLNLTLQKQLDYIDHAIQKDMKFRNALKGIIIGQFTVEEYELYVENSSALNKRMMTIVRERLITNVQVFSNTPEVIQSN
ncbi:MAG: glyoxalase [Winogradskyella sp.]|uniref:glyoxalase n=1 Tax=Winogradskyella sp. TaxID=1883156 RepID=UPI00385A220A